MRDALDASKCLQNVCSHVAISEVVEFRDQGRFFPGAGAVPLRVQELQAAFVYPPMGLGRSARAPTMYT